jgi:signal transduction histidine kinase
LENTRLIEKATSAERLSAIGEMAAGIAHEIRNPLSAIGTLIDILESQTSGGDPLLFKGIKEESRRLEQIITRFLNYARPYTPERKPADINLLLDEIMSILGKEDRYRNVNFIRHFDRSIGTFPADADGLKQVFWNIILNGLEAMNGSGALTVRSAEERDRAVIEVADTGPGIPEAVAAKVFEPFFTRKEKGTGLGMAIANKVVKAHGGEISLGKGAESGACVRVSIPKV